MQLDRLDHLVLTTCGYYRYQLLREDHSRSYPKSMIRSSPLFRFSTLFCLQSCRTMEPAVPTRKPFSAVLNGSIAVETRTGGK